MLPPPFENALVLTGPTGSGKTRLAIELAPRLNAEIVAMDSMTLYRGMDIGTAKPNQEERAAVPHHLIDALEPCESASVAWWLEEAKRCCREIDERGKRVLFVGGTPLYLKALMCGLFDGPPADAELRQRLTAKANALGSAALHEQLAVVDPVSAGRIHPNDVRRTIRALEVHELTGKPMSEWQTQWAAGSRQPSAVAASVLCLEQPREELYARIEARVDKMFADGLLDEARRLQGLNRPLSVESSQAVGYKEAFQVLQGTITTVDAIVRVKTRSRNLAKRQMTWFRHLPGCSPATMELTRTLWADKMRG